MCGIAGKLFLRGQKRVDPSLIEEMGSIMRYRGPDDSGVYTSGRIGLGHRRLSIIDLQTGKQPLSNEDGTVWVVFNGEIYNFLELRAELLGRGHSFKTTTDTEVIVHLYEDYGEGFVSKLRGMFAIALWDDTKDILVLARDRVGIKPLYYYINDEAIVFASELKAILVDKDVSREVDLGALRRLLRYYYLPGEETLLRGIKKLLPGHYLMVEGGKLVDREYWDLAFPRAVQGISSDEASRRLTEIVAQAVRDHMISDVPVGFLLSGGVDSTALLSHAVEETGRKISTFTIGFGGEGFADERYYARLAAKTFGTEHHDLSITAADFRDFLPEYVWHMEEPICEPPAVALYYVSKLAKEYVKVLISGEGGDEAFAGYSNYRNLVWLERIKRVGGALTHLGAPMSSAVTGFGPLKRFRQYSALMRMDFEDYYLSRTATPLTFFNRDAKGLYQEDFLEATHESDDDRYRESLLGRVGDLDVLNKMLYVDSKTWLPDDLLLKADKITMANSIELRVPLLDHVVLEYAASLPPKLKMRGFRTKYVLKKAFEGRVPDEILNRKKTGFPVPYERWLSNELSEYVKGILLDAKTLDRGYLRPDAMVRFLKEERRGPGDSKGLFLLVALELWHRRFVDSIAA